MPDGFPSLSGRGLQPAASEPFADRTVVCLEHCVCQQHGEDEHSGAHCGMGVERGVRMGVDPVDLHVDKREVRKAEGVGELAEELHIFMLFLPVMRLPAPAATISGKMSRMQSELYAPLRMLPSPPMHGMAKAVSRMSEHHQKPPLRRMNFPALEMRRPQRNG